jgi:hypothetical protein
VAAVWLSINTRPPEWDHANHLERTVACAHDLAAGNVEALLGRSTFYPPLVFCTAALAYRLWPSDAAAAQATILAFLGAGMVAVYLLGRRLASGSAGVVAALLFGTAPFVVYSALRFQLDLPLASMVAVALLLLLCTERFTRPGWSIAAGVVLGLGMLTKPPFAAYMLAPLALVVAGIRQRRATLNFVLALVVGAVPALPWYGLRLFGLAAQVSNRSFKQAAESGFPDPLTWPALAYYPRTFVTQFGVVAALLLVAGLAVAVRRRPWFALIALLPAFALFELLQNKNFRYTLPLLPVAAVVAGLGFDALRGRARTAVAVVVGIAAAIQVSATVADVPGDVTVPGLRVPLVMSSPPAREDWRQREILRLVTRDSGGAARVVSVVPNHPFFSAANFRYYGLRDDLRLGIGRAWSDYPLNIDYLVLKTGHQGPEFSIAKAQRINERFARDPFLAAAFPAIGAFALPDGSVATVRVRRPAPVTGLSALALAERVRAGAGSLLKEFVADPEGLRIALDYEAAALARGTIRRVTINAAAARVGELRRPNAATLRLRDVRVVLENLTVNPARAAAEGAVEPLALERFRIERLRLSETDLQAFLLELKRMQRLRVAFLDDAVQVHVAQGGPDVDLRLSIMPGQDGRPIVLDARAVRVAGVPVPDALTGWIVRNYDPTLRWSRLPVAVEVAPVRIRKGVLEVGGE